MDHAYSLLEKPEHVQHMLKLLLTTVPQDVAEHYWKTPEGNEPGHGAKAIYDWTQTQGESLQRLRKGSPAGGEAGKPD